MGDAAAPAIDLIPELERAINAGDTRLVVALHLVRAYDAAGRHGEALALMSRIASLAPRADVQRRLAAMARRMNRADVAAIALRRWAALCPGDPVARHLGAAASGERLARADADYVRTVFDAYAPRFDEHLGALDYRAPQLVAAAVERTRAARQFARAVDLGCGTGMLGPLLRNRITELVGVDLSPAMLARAGERRSYDQLHEADLVEFLDGTESAPFDLVLAADTLNYFGDLTPVFGAAARALGSGGVFAFTLELDDHAADYRLHPSGRFGHGERWVTESLVAAGLVVEMSERAALRREGGADAAGLVVVAVRTGGLPGSLPRRAVSQFDDERR